MDKRMGFNGWHLLRASGLSLCPAAVHVRGIRQSSTQVGEMQGVLGTTRPDWPGIGLVGPPGRARA